MIERFKQGWNTILKEIKREQRKKVVAEIDSKLKDIENAKHDVKF